MSRLNPEPENRPGGPAAFQTTPDGSVDPDPNGDFATEHNDASYAGDLRGGPEGAKEPESPASRAGMDPS